MTNKWVTDLLAALGASENRQGAVRISTVTAAHSMQQRDTSKNSSLLDSLLGRSLL